jgi:hypothetical protein
VLGWPKRCKLAHAFLWEYSYKRLKLAQRLGQLGAFLTRGASASPVHLEGLALGLQRRDPLHQLCDGGGTISTFEGLVEANRCQAPPNSNQVRSIVVDLGEPGNDWPRGAAFRRRLGASAHGPAARLAPSGHTAAVRPSAKGAGGVAARGGGKPSFGPPRSPAASSAFVITPARPKFFSASEWGNGCPPATPRAHRRHPCLAR